MVLRSTVVINCAGMQTMLWTSATSDKSKTALRQANIKLRLAPSPWQFCIPPKIDQLETLLAAYISLRSLHEIYGVTKCPVLEDTAHFIAPNRRTKLHTMFDRSRILS